MSDDRELLELAAKAAGINAVREFTFECDGSSSGECKSGLWNRDDGGIWNPLTDDGDALRLAVKLGIDIGRGIGNKRWAVESTSSRTFYESSERDGVQDEYAATRRAIVRAAASLSKTKD